MKSSLLYALGSMCMLMGVAQADLTWTETIKTSGNTGTPAAMGAMSMKATHYMNSQASRADTRIQFGPVAMMTRQIDLCHTKKTLSFFDEGRLYSEDSLRVGSLLPSMMGRPSSVASNKPKRKGTQTISFNFRDLGAATVMNTPTRHYALDMTMTAGGCAGRSSRKINMEVWSANFAMPAPCLATTFEGAMKNTVSASPRGDCDVKIKFQGNTNGASKAFKGFMMRMKIGFAEGSFTREVTKISRSPIPASTFRVPAGYRKVSSNDLNKARQSAMMQGMMGRMGNR